MVWTQVPRGREDILGDLNCSIEEINPLQKKKEEKRNLQRGKNARRKQTSRMRGKGEGGTQKHLNLGKRELLPHKNTQIDS